MWLFTWNELDKWKKLTKNAIEKKLLGEIIEQTHINKGFVHIVAFSVRVNCFLARKLFAKFPPTILHA